MSQGIMAREESLSQERLTVGVAARLSRYLQVLTQAKKMGRDSISSQEIGEYTNVNATQIRRDLSRFGKFGKRGVGYNIDLLIGEIRGILRTSGQHNIALIGAGDLGRAIATSTVFADHGFHNAGVFDTDPAKIGTHVASLAVQDPATLDETVREKNVIVGVLAVPPAAPQPAAAARPDAGPLLPVFVLDRYEGMEARRVGDLTSAELEWYLDANVAALRSELDREPAALVLANHAIMGGPVAAAGCEPSRTPYAVKLH